MAIWWGSETRGDIVGIMKEVECPFCNNKTNMQIVKQTTTNVFMIIPWWSTKYICTCGTCFTSFEIPKEEGKKLEEQVKQLEIQEVSSGS